VFAEVGGPDVLSMAEMPRPDVRPGTVLIKTHAIGGTSLHIGKTFPLAQAPEAIAISNRDSRRES
jgi:hypothetical protein